MINTITKVVNRIINSKRLEELEKKVLDKYEAFVTPPAQSEPEKKEEPPVVEKV